MSNKKNKYLINFLEVYKPVLRENKLRRIADIYLEDKKSKNMQVYKHDVYQLEFFSNYWVLSRTIEGITRKVVLQKDELELLDVNDIQGSLPDLIYYVDVIKGRLGM